MQTEAKKRERSTNLAILTPRQAAHACLESRKSEEMLPLSFSLWDGEMYVTAHVSGVEHVSAVVVVDRIMEPLVVYTLVSTVHVRDTVYTPGNNTSTPEEAKVWLIGVFEQLSEGTDEHGRENLSQIIVHGQYR